MARASPICDKHGETVIFKERGEIPVMFDYVTLNTESFNHVPGGTNVLYLDGHVKFVKYPGEFPASRAFAVLLGAFPEP